MENKKPFFSIVIPTWNRADMIGKTIDSVLAQTYNNYELIIVDDGSTDNTKQVTESYSDNRITYVYQENQERGAARNHGIKLSKGNYITFLDSDDLFLPNHLDSVYKQIASLNFPPLFHQPYKIFDDNNNEIFFNPKIRNPIKYLIKHGNFIGSVGLFISGREAFQFQFDESISLAGSEDYDLILRLILFHQLNIGNEKTTIVIHHENRSEVNINVDKLLKRIEYIIDKKKNDQQFCKLFGPWLNSFYSSNWSYLALHYSIHRYKKNALKYFWRSLKLYPLSIFRKRSFVIIKKLLF